MMKLGRSSRSTLISPMEQHGKQTPRVPTTTFLAAVGFLPVWAVTVVPLTVCYQIGKKIVSTLAPSSPPEPVPSLDSGYIVDEKSIIPRPDRKYDIVILGVTGFTGRLAALHLAKTYGVAAASGDPKKTVKWAVAGRNESKLRQVMKELAVECNNPAIGTDIDTIVVDTSVPSSMPKLVEQTRCVATTAGPYTLYGNAVVEFCAKYGTHYVDITGEIDWIRHMIVQWQSTAQHTGAILVPFCGHE